MTHLPPMPRRIAALPRNAAGYPVPFFVAWIDGMPDFRVADPAKLARCVRERRCWLCGEVLGAYLAFVIGPMCAVNRISAEPPSHTECALFAAGACPFLTRPHMHRRERGLPQDTHEAAGIPILRNPGVALVWVTRGYERVAAPGGVLFHMGEPVETRWYCGGRTATRAEVLTSMETGLPALQDMAAQDGPEAVAALEHAHAAALALVPAGVS